MGAAPARYMRDVLAEQLDRSGIGREFSGNQIEQSCLARPVGADDQPPLPGLDVQIDIGRHVQAAERLAKSLDGEGAHGFASAPPDTTFAARRSEEHTSELQSL